MKKILLLSVFAAMFAVVSCGEYNTAPKSGQGENCTKTADCRDGLKCINLVCVNDNGNTGDTGNTGNSGDTGDTGNTGNSGDSGNSGNSGDSGNSGNSGNSGDTGDSGNTGDTGNTGDSGDTGNTGNTGNSGDTGNSGNSGDTGDSGCATSNLGKSCTTDTDCGKCMICTINSGGKCVKGCTTNDDCTMYTGLKCNKKLARCTNVFASLQACGETKCPTGCCYADKGLTGVKCLTTAEPSKCGLCSQGEIYIPDDSKCVPAVCSTTTNNCPTLNSGSTNPKPSCFECKSGEFICQADTTSAGCSANVIINAKECISSGKQCVPGTSECCSGMPCVQGYCY